MPVLWRIFAAVATVLAVMFAFVYTLRFYFGLTQTRIPTTEKLLRPPGESLGRKLAELDDKLLYAIVIFVSGPVVLAYQTWSIPFTHFLVLLVPLVCVLSIPVWVIALRRRNYALGYLGERAVGEELNQLLRQGCHVFHDFPGGSNWNIDHIVVAPSGVYSIETKTRRKRRGRKGTRSHEVIFDGKILTYPHCTDSHGLDQARRNAVSLSRELTSSTGEPVKAKPILTLPGWLVTLKGKGDVHVLNPKQIRQVILGNSGPTLSPAQMQRIAHQIDQKCRDVEL